MRQNASLRNCVSGLRSSHWNCMPTKRVSSSSAALRNGIGATVATANQRPSTSSDLRTAAQRRGGAGLRFCGRRCGRGGKPSCGNSKSYCGNACTRPSRNRGLSALGPAGSHPLLWCAHEWPGTGSLSHGSGLSVADSFAPTQSRQPPAVAPYGTSHYSVASACTYLSSLSPYASARHHPRWEPDALCGLPTYVASSP